MSSFGNLYHFLMNIGFSTVSRFHLTFLGTLPNRFYRCSSPTAMYNYVEMRAHVNSKLFLLRKAVDNLLHAVLGSSWVPLYTSVSFQRMRYSDCIANKDWQDRFIDNLFKWVAAAFLFLVTAWIFWNAGRGSSPLGWEDVAGMIG